MTDISIFQDKAIKPCETELAEKLGSTYEIWVQTHDFVFEKYPEGRGIRIDIEENTKISDIKRLVEIKLSN